MRIHPVREEAPSFAAHAGGVDKARLSPDGRLLVTAGRDGTARLWGLEGGHPDDPPPAPVTLEGHRGTTVAAMAPSGLTVATAGEEGSVRVWNAAGHLLRTFEARPGKSPLVLFSPDGKLVAYAGPGDTVRVGDVDSGSTRIFAGHGGAVEALAFSPRGDRLASAGQDAAVRLWDLGPAGSPGPAPAPILLGHVGAVTALAFSPDGATLVSGGRDHTLRFWPVAGGDARTVAVGGGGVQRVMFTRDGRTLLYTSRLESAVQQMDAATGRDLGALLAHEGDLSSIALSPDETRVAAATTEGQVRPLGSSQSGESLHRLLSATPARRARWRSPPTAAS